MDLGLIKIVGFLDFGLFKIGGYVDLDLFKIKDTMRSGFFCRLKFGFLPINM